MSARIITDAEIEAQKQSLDATVTKLSESIDELKREHAELRAALIAASAQLRKRECSIKDCAVLDQADAALANSEGRS